MNDVIMRWLQLPLALKIGSLVASMLLLLLSGWLLLLRPQQLAQQQLQQDLAALRSAARQYQLQLNQLPAPAALLERRQRAEAQLASQPEGASVETLLADRGEQLASWQPDAEPKQLSLRLSWDEFQPLFAHLQRLQPTPLPARFLLQADKDRLSAQLWLEIGDEE